MTRWKRRTDLVWSRPLSLNVVLYVFGDRRGRWNPQISLCGRSILPTDHFVATRRRAMFEARREAMQLAEPLRKGLEL